MLNSVLSLGEFMFLSTIAGMFIIGLNRAFHYDEADGFVIEDSKMIFWKIHYTASKYISKFWLKPLFSCPWCMASIYSWPVYWSYNLCFYPLSIALFIKFLFFIPVVSCIAGYINAKLNEI